MKVDDFTFGEVEPLVVHALGFEAFEKTVNFDLGETTLVGDPPR